jgi:hypothetical protein
MNEHRYEMNSRRNVDAKEEYETNKVESLPGRHRDNFLVLYRSTYDIKYQRL